MSILHIPYIAVWEYSNHKIFEFWAATRTGKVCVSTAPYFPLGYRLRAKRKPPDRCVKRLHVVVLGSHKVDVAGKRRFYSLRSYANVSLCNYCTAVL